MKKEPLGNTNLRDLIQNKTETHSKITFAEISSIYIEGPRTKFLHFNFILTGVLLKTVGLYLNLSVYQICCSMFPEKQRESIYQFFRLKNYKGD